jgi:hypothetical protein
MKRQLVAVFTAFAVCAGVTALGAAEGEKTFPEPGSKVPSAFSVLVLNGEWKDKKGETVYQYPTWKDQDGKPVDRYHSPVTQFGLGPVVLVFVGKDQHKDKDVLSFLKKLDAKIDDNQDAGLNGCVVFLGHDDGRKIDAKGKKGDGGEDTEKKADSKELLRLANEMENLKKDLRGENQGTQPLGLKHVVVGIGPPDGPKGYAVDKSKAVTVILYEKFRVKASHSYKVGDLDDKAADKLLAEVDKELLGKGPKKVESEK